MQQQVRGVFIHAQCAGPFKFIHSVSARQQPHAQRAAAPRSEHVPDAVTHHDAMLDRHAQTRRRCNEEIRVRLGVLHVVAL